MQHAGDLQNGRNLRPDRAVDHENHATVVVLHDSLLYKRSTGLFLGSATGFSPALLMSSRCLHCFRGLCASSIVDIRAFERLNVRFSVTRAAHSSRNKTLSGLYATQDKTKSQITTDRHIPSLWQHIPTLHACWLLPNGLGCECQHGGMDL